MSASETKLQEDIALVRQYTDTIICLLPNMMGVLDRCLAAAEAHERCGGELDALRQLSMRVRLYLNEPNSERMSRLVRAYDECRTTRNEIFEKQNESLRTPTQASDDE
jgi:hypothetical protein